VSVTSKPAKPITVTIPRVPIKLGPKGGRDGLQPVRHQRDFNRAILVDVVELHVRVGKNYLSTHGGPIYIGQVSAVHEWFPVNPNKRPVLRIHLDPQGLEDALPGAREFLSGEFRTWKAVREALAKFSRHLVFLGVWR
jgi:hypothetical protein